MTGVLLVRHRLSQMERCLGYGGELGNLGSHGPHYREAVRTRQKVLPPRRFGWGRVQLKERKIAKSIHGSISAPHVEVSLVCSHVGVKKQQTKKTPPPPKKPIPGATAFKVSNRSQTENAGPLK